MTNPAPLVDPAHVPVPLRKAAAELGLPVTALRAEIDKGKLKSFKIGKNLYTSAFMVRAWLDDKARPECRDDKSPPAFGSEKMAVGSSSTAADKSQLDSLATAVKRLKANCNHTLPQSRPTRRDAKVVPIKS